MTEGHTGRHSHRARRGGDRADSVPAVSRRVQRRQDQRTSAGEGHSDDDHEAIHRITRNEGDFGGAFRQNVIRVIGSYGREQQLDEYTGRIKAKQEEMVALIAENAKTGTYTQEFDERYCRIAEEINGLKEEQAETGKKKKLAENYGQWVKDMDAFLNGNSGQIPKFDNDLVRRLVASIRVITADRIQIQFQSGIVMEQGIGNE